MKKSKHFRKDVIIARIIFALLCIIVGTLIGMGISALTNKADNNHREDTQTQQTQEHESTEYFETEETEEETEPVEEIVVYAQTTAKVNMRQEPNTTSAILASVPNATKMTLIEEVDGWYKVIYNEKEGYIRGDYIELVEETVVNTEEANNGQ